MIRKLKLESRGYKRENKMDKVLFSFTPEDVSSKSKKYKEYVNKQHWRFR